MKVDTAMLKGKIVEKGFTQEDLARQMAIDSSTFSRKMKSDGLNFSIGEMHKIAEGLGLTKNEASKIFLSQNSQ